jgi:hypothetical protein
MFTLRKTKTVTTPVEAPVDTTLQRLDNLEKRLRGLEDHYTELEHAISEKEQAFKDSLEEYKTTVNTTVADFTSRVLELQQELRKTGHYSVKHDELNKLVGKFAEAFENIKKDMELPF